MTKRAFRLICLVVSVVMIALCATSCGFLDLFKPQKTEADEDEGRENVAGVGKRQSDDESGANGDGSFVPVLRFAVVSDLHMSAEPDDLAVERLQQAKQAAAGNAKLDAFVVAGDFTATGAEAEYEAFFEAANAALGEQTALLVCMGDRETGGAANIGAAEALYLSASDSNNTDTHVVIGGCHFIGISPDKADGTFSDTKIDWLQSQLADIDKADNHPIFIFQHRPVKDTVFGSDDGLANLEKVLKSYPAVVDLSGHTLYDPTDPRAVMQEKYTCVSVGSLSYRLGEISGVVNDTDYSYSAIFPTDVMGGWSPLYNEELAAGLHNAADVCLIEVDAQNRVRIRYYDLLSGEWSDNVVLLSGLAKTKNFTYNYNRQYDGGPEFEEGAVLRADIVTSRSISVSIPTAAGANGVQHYRCTLMQGDTEVRTVYRLANTGGSVRVPFVGLTPNKTYSLTVTPVDTWRTDGEQPLTLEITTPAVNDTLPDPDLLSLQFRANNTAYDQVSGTTLLPVGTTEVQACEVYGGYEADFNGHSHYQYYDFAYCQEAVRNSFAFTFETVLKMDTLPATGSYVNPLSSQESGGLGFEVNGSTLQFWCFINRDYVTVQTAISAGEYMHIVVTFNGLQLCLYVNGELAASKTAFGRIVLSSVERARYLGVGADANAGMTDGGTAADCTMVSAAMWGEALSADQVMLRYNYKKAPLPVAGFENLDAVTNADDGFVPVIRFAVTSDVHTRAKGGKGAPTEDELAASLLRTTGVFRHSYQYAEMSDYQNVDAVIVVGDYTDNGTVNEYSSFRSIVNAEKQEDTELLVCLGNHEFLDTEESGSSNTDMGDTYARFEQYFGHEPDSHNVINGYHFIGVSPDCNGGRNYSEAKAAWLEEQLQIAAADDPTGQKPIFVYQHISPAYSVYGSSSTADPNAAYAAISTGNIMKNYPQVVLFSGHSHRPATDPASIMQSDYTVLGTGTLAYGCYEIYTDEGTLGVLTQNETGGLFYSSMGDYYNEHGLRECSVFMIVEVDAENRVRIRYVDIDSHCLVGEPIIIDSIGRKDDFTLTADRAENGEAPYFAEGAAITVTETWSTEVSFSFPQAISRDTVRNYKVEVYENDAPVDKFYLLSNVYFANAPTALIAPCKGLAPATAYTVKVYAYNTWGQISAVPLTGAFTTAAAGDVTTPDIFSLTFRDDGTAYNAVTGEDLVRTGRATTAHDDTLDATVGVFTGSGDYQWREIADYYDVMAGGFTFEVYARVNGAPSSGYVDICSSQQRGGFGFEYKADGKIYYFLHSETAREYVKPCGALPVGEYVHLVGTYDGAAVRLYINGELVASAAMQGNVFFQLQPSAQYLSIGADAGTDLTSHAGCTGRVAIANIYSTALDADQVAALFGALPTA